MMTFLKSTYAFVRANFLANQSILNVFDFFYDVINCPALPRPNDDDDERLDDIFETYIPWPLFVQNCEPIGAV